MDKKKEEVYQHLVQHTAKHLQQKGGLGRDALNISIDLQMDRSNVSRLLNQLHHEGRLIKTQGRPTLFLQEHPWKMSIRMCMYLALFPREKAFIAI